MCGPSFSVRSWVASHAVILARSNCRWMHPPFTRLSPRKATTSVTTVPNRPSTQTVVPSRLHSAAQRAAAAGGPAAAHHGQRLGGTCHTGGRLGPSSGTAASVCSGVPGWCRGAQGGRRRSLPAWARAVQGCVCPCLGTARTHARFAAAALLAVCVWLPMACECGQSWHSQHSVACGTRAWARCSPC